MERSIKQKKKTFLFTTPSHFRAAFNHNYAAIISVDNTLISSVLNKGIVVEWLRSIIGSFHVCVIDLLAMAGCKHVSISQPKGVLCVCM